MSFPISAPQLHASLRSGLRSFRRAVSQQGDIARSFRIGGRRVRIVAAGHAPLAAVSAALEHLSVPDEGEADVTIGVWAGGNGTAPAEMPPPGIYVAPQSGIQAVVDAAPPALALYAQRFRLGLWWTANGPSPHAYASPLRATLAAALRPFGLVGLHAGVVGDTHGGALLAGAGGAGKSTTALACGLAGMMLVAEDFCLAQAEPAPVAFSLYNSAKLTPRSQAWLALPPAADTGLLAEEKRIYLLHRTPGITLAESLPIRAVLILCITDAPYSCLRPATRMEAINALAPTSVRLMGLPAQSAAAVFHSAAALVRQVRCYRLELGADVMAAPALVKAAIRGEVSHVC